jgi:hypothetical protein
MLESYMLYLRIIPHFVPINNAPASIMIIRGHILWSPDKISRLRFSHISIIFLPTLGTSNAASSTVSFSSDIANQLVQVASESRLQKGCGTSFSRCPMPVTTLKERRPGPLAAFETDRWQLGLRIEAAEDVVESPHGNLATPSG